MRLSRALMLILLLLGVDQYSKWLVSQHIPPWRVVKLTSFLNLVNVRNRGMVFGFLSDSRNPVVFWIITLASLAAAVFVLYLFFREKSRVARFSLSLIIAGALGNLLNRFTQGSVLDFIDLHWGKYHWPVFNFADACITVGSAVFIVYLLLKGGEDVSHTG